VDARHTPRKTAAIITPTADTVFTVTGHAPEPCDSRATIDWETEATEHFTGDWAKDHGRLEQRSIAVFTPPVGRITDPGLRPVARITRDREPLKPDPKRAKKEQETDLPTDTGTATIRTARDADTAAPEDRLRTNRGHWGVEGVWTIAIRAPGIGSLIRSLPKTPAHRTVSAHRERHWKQPRQPRAPEHPRTGCGPDEPTPERRLRHRTAAAAKPDTGRDQGRVGHPASPHRDAHRRPSRPRSIPHIRTGRSADGSGPPVPGSLPAPGQTESQTAGSGRRPARPSRVRDGYHDMTQKGSRRRHQI